jgi:protein SCO1/2
MSREPHETDKFPSRLMLCALGLALALALGACQSGDAPGSYVANSKADGLPDVTLVDQNGHSLSLSPLKGKPVLIDFIYTSCHGPCPMLTSKLAFIARLLPHELGTKVTLVSITLDPEHDHPAQLLDYTRSHGANREGWLFLTGSPAQIEQVLAAYGLRRKREADGSVTHMTSVFLLGPDGHQMRIYNGLEAKPTSVTADILRTLG